MRPDEVPVATAPKRPTIALVGPSPQTHGGVGAMIGILAESDLHERYRIELVATYRDGSRSQKAIQAVRGFLRLAVLSFGRRVDLIHIHSSWGASLTRKLIALAIVRASRRPVILHFHGGAFHKEIARPGVWGKTRRRTIRWALKSADVVIALTPGWAEELRRLGTISNLRIVPNAPSLAFPHARNGSTPGSRTIIYLGHLYREKGVFELVDAFAEIRPQHPDVRLVLAGDGWDAEELERHVAARGLGPDAVELPGWIGSDAKAQLLDSASCFALPSYYEGLPLSMLEALSAGVPVVTTPVGGIPEVVSDGMEALLVPPCDSQALATALRRVLTDDALAATLSQAGRRRALEEYSSAALAERVGVIYAELLEATASF